MLLEAVNHPPALPSASLEIIYVKGLIISQQPHIELETTETSPLPVWTKAGESETGVSTLLSLGKFCAVASIPAARMIGCVASLPSKAKELARAHTNICDRQPVIVVTQLKQKLDDSQLHTAQQGNELCRNLGD